MQRFKRQDDDEELPQRWQQLFREAVIELDRDKLKERIAAVELAIFQRQQEINGNPNCEAERQSIEDALKTLLALQREILGFPNWEEM